MVRSVGLNASRSTDRSSKSASEAEERAIGNVGNARLSFYLDRGDTTASNPTQGVDWHLDSTQLEKRFTVSLPPLQKFVQVKALRAC